MRLGEKLKESLKPAVRRLGNWHRHDPAHRPIFVFSTPRSGSTWLTELFLSQPGFRPCDEPFNLRSQQVRVALGLETWTALYDPANEQRIRSYLEGFIYGHGASAFKNLLPTQRHYRFRTSRVVFKILHALEHRIDWVEQALGGQVYFLIRHPIPVALSREVTPRLEVFLEAPFVDHLDEAQRSVAQDVIERGDRLERNVLDWCLQNAVALRNKAARRGLITYEQLVLDPEPVLQRLYHEAGLSDLQRMRDQLSRPSRSVSKSAPETAQALHARRQERQWLVEKWRDRIDTPTERRLMDLVRQFGIEIYSAGSAKPHPDFWVPPVSSTHAPHLTTSAPHTGHG